MAKPEQVTTSEIYNATATSAATTIGHYEAYETRYDEAGVWSAQTDKQWDCKNFAEARRMARALAEEYAALNA